MSPPDNQIASDANAKLTFGKALRGGLREAVQPLLNFVNTVGDHLLMLARSAYWMIRPPYRVRLLVDSCEFVGVGSIPIIALVGAFTGMVTALQAVNQLRTLGAEGFAGSATGLALSTELAPVMTALMLAGRAGAGIATELGTMRITEQIDALETMAVSPIQYLVVPRVMAGFLMAPLLMLVFFGIGMSGGYLVAVKGMGVDHGLFIYNLTKSLQMGHVIQGVLKSFIFGGAFSLIGCFQGYYAAGGGRGVGLATTRAVVIASVTILVLDYFITDILLVVMPVGS